MKLAYLTILLLGVTVVNVYAAVVPTETAPAVITIIETRDGTPIALEADIPASIVDGPEPVEDEFKLPEGVTPCHKDDPKLNQCIRNSINQQLPQLNKGNQVLNIPALDPLRIPDGRYGYASGPVGGNLFIKNTNVYGVTKATIRKVNTKVLDDGILTAMLVYLPRLFIEGNYKAEVKINELKMRPKGYFNLTLSDVKLTAKMAGKYQIINGKKHLQLNQVEAEPEIGDLKVYATGIFPDPALNNVVLDFANQYWPEIVKTVVPQTKETWEPIVLETANKFLASVPIEKLLIKSSSD